MTIRKVNENDLAAILEIERLCHYQPWTEEIFKQCFHQNCLTWVIEESTQIIGFIICTTQLGECHILNLAVIPSKRRQGYGELLLKFAMRKVKEHGSGMAFLEVRKSNEAAIALYQKLGFVEIGKRKDYYQIPDGYEDAILLAKDLTVT